MNNKNYGKTKLACYLGFVTQAICAIFLPLLYVTFNKTYGISLGKLAALSTTYFFTQLLTDAVCSKITDRLGVRTSVIISEITSGVGLLGLSILPDIMPDPFSGILMCVIVYAVGAGMTEVLVSPIIEACPFENKAATMSLLHSFYCWGSAGVILGSTLFFAVFGIERWRTLAIIWALIPLYNIYNFATCPMEKLVEDGEGMSMKELVKTRLFWIFIILMVCAGSSEIAMAQWASAFAESALHVSKSVGDIAGPCGFAVTMGISRAIYGKFGGKINLTVFMAASGILCLICYLMAGLSKNPLLGLAGCALCGFSVGIMWPGSISISSKLLPKGGTAMFALLALSGDLGGSLGPAIVGKISEEFGNDLRTGVLAGAGFPVVLVVTLVFLNSFSGHMLNGQVKHRRS